MSKKVLDFLQSSSCFGREVCLSLPCACAQSLADLVAVEREQCAKVAAVADAAQIYFMKYLQDEAEELEVCFSEEQHEDAKALRAAIRARGQE